MLLAAGKMVNRGLDELGGQKEARKLFESFRLLTERMQRSCCAARENEGGVYFNSAVFSALKRQMVYFIPYTVLFYSSTLLDHTDTVEKFDRIALLTVIH